MFNGTQYAMDIAGTSQFSADKRNETLTVEGVFQTGSHEETIDGKEVTVPDYETRSKSWDAGSTYEFNGVVMSGYNIIKNYYTDYYTQEATNYITKVNLLRLRTLSLT